MTSTKPSIKIEYCTQCNWMLRAAWLAQELLQTFGQDLSSVTLVPGTGGVFTIKTDDQILWDRVKDGGFPEAKVLKQRLRDLVWPERQLGHLDR
jgi:selenoprotein W-related protein